MHKHLMDDNVTMHGEASTTRSLLLKVRLVGAVLGVVILVACLMLAWRIGGEIVSAIHEPTRLEQALDLWEKAIQGDRDIAGLMVVEHPVSGPVGELIGPDEVDEGGVAAPQATVTPVLRLDVARPLGTFAILLLVALLILVVMKVAGVGVKLIIHAVADEDVVRRAIRQSRKEKGRS